MGAEACELPEETRSKYLTCFVLISRSKEAPASKNHSLPPDIAPTRGRIAYNSASRQETRKATRFRWKTFCLRRPVSQLWSPSCKLASHNEILRFVAMTWVEVPFLKEIAAPADEMWWVSKAKPDASPNLNEPSWLDSLRNSFESVLLMHTFQQVLIFQNSLADEPLEHARRRTRNDELKFGVFVLGETFAASPTTASVYSSGYRRVM